ncbi:MAG: cellulase family glycosylhydrolase [Planctomycetaceae bacterium]
MTRSAMILWTAIACVLPFECTLAAAQEWIRVSEDGTHFVQQSDGQTFRPMGFNYDHDEQGRLLEDYWHAEWPKVEADFAEMKALGATVVRIHIQFGRFMESPDSARTAELEQLAKLVRLAESTGLYLDLTGLGCYHKADVPAWYDELSEADRWKAQTIFWENVAKVCSSSPAIFCYDLMNEPVIGGEQPAKEWLGPPFAGKHFVQFVARETRGRTRPEAAKQWIDQLVEAIRKHDSKHLITVGLVDWSLDRPGLTSGFDPKKVTEKLDFLAIHLYPKTGKVDEALSTLDGFQIGKPVVIEETFPLGCSLEEMDQFIDKAGDRASGWISFYWGRTLEEMNSPATIGDAIMAKWLARFSARLQNAPASADAKELSAGEKAVAAMIQYSMLHPDGAAAHSVDLTAWKQETRDLPIGVFDSGIGGLTVLEAILAADSFDNTTLRPGPDGRPDFANERFIYFGDQANMPYGNYPSAGKEGYLKELILKDAAFLLGRRYWATPASRTPSMNKPPVKAIVIACNTATAWGMEEIRMMIDAWQIPVFVVGVVEAGARGVLELEALPGSQPRTVAVLATTGTCNSNAYPKAISRMLGRAGRREASVVQQGSIGLAGAIETDPAFIAVSAESRSNYSGPAVSSPIAKIDPKLLPIYSFDATGLIGDSKTPESLQLNSVENYIRYDVTTLVESWKSKGGATPIDSVILGCTHFPLVKSELLQEFDRLRSLEVDGQRPYEHLIAAKIDVVDPASLTAGELFRELARQSLFAKSREPESRDLFFMSIASPEAPEQHRTGDGGLTKDYKYGREPGQLDREDTRNVRMIPNMLPETSRRLVQNRLPEVWKRLNSDL